MVTEQKFETVDGYSIADIDGAARLVGPVRSAKKVLQRTTIDLVRHATYACAAYELDAVGGAAALNHDRAGEDQSPISAFVEELTTWAASANFVGSAGLGLGADEIGPTLHSSAALATELVAASAVASIPPATTLIVIASDGEEPALQAQIAVELPKALVSVESDLGAALTSGAEAVFVRGKTGALNHEVVAETDVGYIVGLQPLTTTARGLAVASSQGAIVVPDFLSTAGPYLAALDDLDAAGIAAATATVRDRIADAGTNSFVAACELAENHLRTWAAELPFGRPLAP